MPPLHSFVDMLLRTHLPTIDNASPFPNLLPTPSPSPPERSLIRAPPGWPAIPQHGPIPSPSPTPRSVAINTSPPAPQVRRFNIVELSWGQVNSCWTTAFLLADAQTGHLFHGTLPCRPWLRNYENAGLEVTDFRVGNQPILPVCDTYLYPRFEEGKGKWLRYMPSPFSPHPVLSRRVRIKSPYILERREFAFNSSGYASRLRNEISICERIRRNPSPYLAEYKGCQVDQWGRVTGIAYKRYHTNLLEFVKERRLERMHVPDVKLAIAKAVEHLKSMDIHYGNISPENVYITWIWQGNHVWLNEVVLGDFEHAVAGEMPVDKKEEVMVKVEEKTEWLGRVFSAEVDQVYEVRTKMGLRTEFNSVGRLNLWMRENLGF